MKRVVRRLLPLLAMVPGALVPGLASAADTNGHKEVEFEKFRVVLDVTAPGARAPTWYVSGTRVAPAYSSAPFYRNAPGPWPHDTIRLASYRFKIAGTEVDAATRPPDAGGGTTGGSTTGGSTTGGGPTTGGDGPLALAAAPRDAAAFLLPARRAPAPEPAPVPSPEPAPEPAQTPAGGEDPWLPLPESEHAWHPVPAIRFASTHFADGAPIEMEYECTYDLMNNGVATGTRTMSVVFTATAYNKLQTLGTNRDSDGNASGYAPRFFISASNGVTEESTNALKPSHKSTPGISALAETRATILARTGDSTAIAAMTHGSVTNFRSSDFSEMISFASDVAGIVQVRDIPLFNIVGFWSCETLDEGVESLSPSVRSYGIVNPDGSTRVDRAYAGFTKKVLAFLYEKSDWASGTPGPTQPTNVDLGNHAQVFWEEIKDGATIEGALRDANDEYPPIMKNGNAWVQIPMRLVGDPRSNLINVYLTKSESDALIAANKTTKRWWIKL